MPNNIKALRALEEYTRDPMQAVAEPTEQKATSLSAYGGGLAPVEQTSWDGEKFFGGFGVTEEQTLDYWTLRKRSAQLFNSNLYARGLIRRLITNEINTGLTPEACPDEYVIGVPEDSLSDWSEQVESRFSVWANTPELCDWEGRRTYGEIQQDARQEALISGDVLVVLRFKRSTGVPALQLVRGDHVVQPPIGANLRRGHTSKHGVEADAVGRHVAFWVKQKNGEVKRLPAYGEKSGRKLAWLVYGTDRRMGEVRGTPLAALVMQSLREVDRYRDSAQRKAVVNSMLAMYIRKTEDKPGTLPVTGGASRKDTVTTQEDAPKTVRTTASIPGVVMEELQQGEEPVGFGSQGTDIDFGKFEEAIIAAVAWANEVPPEILRLAFSNNYSASQAAINEFKIYLNKFWGQWGSSFCAWVWREWLVNEVLRRRVDAPGFLEAWRDPSQLDKFGAWVMCDWYGSIKPSTDTLKQARGSELLLTMGMTTRARESRMNTGTKYSKNIKRLRKENEQLVLAQAPIAEAQAASVAAGVPAATSAPDYEAVINEFLEASSDGH